MHGSGATDVALGLYAQDSSTFTMSGGAMEGELYAEFALLWLVCHQSRVEPRQEDGNADGAGERRLAQIQP